MVWQDVLPDENGRSASVHVVSNERKYQTSENECVVPERLVEIHLSHAFPAGRLRRSCRLAV